MPTTPTPSELIEELRADRNAIARHLMESRDHPLLATDLTVQQVRIVMLIASGAATTGRDLAQKLGVKPPTVSASVDRLVELGFIERDATNPDRRVKHLMATQGGLHLHEKLLGVRSATDELLLELDPDDLRALAQGTRAMRRAVQNASARIAEAS